MIHEIGILREFEVIAYGLILLWLWTQDRRRK
jgi:hypothetical protein